MWLKSHRDRGDRIRGIGRLTALAATAAVLLLAAAEAGALPPEPGCEFRYQPSVGFTCGDHSLDLSFTHRTRIELWDAWLGNSDTFYGLRSRTGVKYSWKDYVTLFGEFQDARTYGLGSSTSGAGTLYRAWGGANTRAKTKGQALRQLWAEVRPVEGLSFRIGRQDIKLGTQAMYPEANWKYLKIKRTSQRLVGTVGWTNVERTNDGMVLQYDTEGYNTYVFVANPTTGVFDHDGGYRRQHSIYYGGISLIAKRNTLVENTEFRGFLLGYDDDRNGSDGGLPDKVGIFTFGGSLIGIYPVGPGNLDLTLWAAGQLGTYNHMDHIAGAAIAEIGYQLPDVWSKPWLRAGVNYASGDTEDNGSHKTFFNMLPTNHLYYGFADQFAFQNLVDVFAQLMLKPHERVALNLMFHQFYLATDWDMQYFGTGAFTKENRPTGANFGYGGRPSGGANEIGQEFDIVLDFKLCTGVAVQGGWAMIWGDKVIDKNVSAGRLNNDKVDFGYLQVTLNY
jgi:hypothetical protein